VNSQLSNTLYAISISPRWAFFVAMYWIYDEFVILEFILFGR